MVYPSDENTKNMNIVVYVIMISIDKDVFKRMQKRKEKNKKERKESRYAGQQRYDARNF